MHSQAAYPIGNGWLSQQDQTTFEAFLKPLTPLEWPILAVLSDKQTGLVPAVTTVPPDSSSQFCQAHYLRNLAAPLAKGDAAFKGALRKTVRQQVGDLIRQEPGTVPGLFPVRSKSPWRQPPKAQHLGTLSPRRVQNTLMIQQVLSEPAWQGRLTAAHLRALTPLLWAYVNPYGTFMLDMSKRLPLEQAA